MRWSFKIFTVSGIGIYLHITFLMLMVLVFSLYLGKGGAETAIQGTGLILAVFGCVLLHELGHALTAKRLGIRTKDIVLLPIGGVARLERMPREPLQELAITVAGPMVNVVIAAVLFGILWLTDVEIGFRLDDVTEARTGLPTFLRELLVINVFLAAFNLIPAFPMDGGRILRSLLALKLDYPRATRIAATIGQGFAVLFGFYGLMIGHWLLVLIAAFVFMGAAGEAATAHLQDLFRGLPVSLAILRKFETLGPDDMLSTAVDKLLGGAQVDFPVTDGDQVLGILTRQQLVASLKERGPGTIVREIALAPVEGIEDGTPLFQAWEALQRQSIGCLPVRSGDRIVGWITSENIAEVAMVREALFR